MFFQWFLEVTRLDFGSSWGAFWGHLGALEAILEASSALLERSSLDAPESILEASGGCLLDYAKTFFSHVFFIDF